MTTAAEIMAFLKSKGYHVETGRGRHGTKAIKGKHKIPLPRHGGTLAKGTVDGILAEAGFSANDLIEWRRL